MWLSQRVLLTDVYSHTAYGSFWPNHEWLAEAVFYALFKVGGLPMLTLFAAGLIVGGWLISWRLARGPFESASRGWRSRSFRQASGGSRGRMHSPSCSS